MIGDHGDELRIGGFSLDVADGISEEFLQRVEVAAVPRHLDGVANFQGLRPERNGALRCCYESVKTK